jgi:hypothetical protein
MLVFIQKRELNSAGWSVMEITWLPFEEQLLTPGAFMPYVKIKGSGKRR